MLVLILLSYVPISWIIALIYAHFHGGIRKSFDPNWDITTQEFYDQLKEICEKDGLDLDLSPLERRLEEERLALDEVLD